MFENIDYEDFATYTLFAIATVIVASLTLFFLMAIGFYIREQLAIFQCIENGGYWLTEGMNGCSYWAG